MKSSKKVNAAAIVGSSFIGNVGQNFAKIVIDTPFGSQTVYETENETNRGYLVFRHGLPHRLLPNQINYKAMIWAIKKLGCTSLLSTSSVGVLCAEIPLFKPLLLDDLLMFENRLPDGSCCTMFSEPSEDHGHLVLREGLFSHALNQQIAELSDGLIFNNHERLVFAYSGGPRTKTSAENRMFKMLGAQVNSMTLAPEVVLANEQEISCAGLVVGHKYSLEKIKTDKDEFNVAESLKLAREAFENIIFRYLHEVRPVDFANEIFRFK